jgi:hypothetical protein
VVELAERALDDPSLVPVQLDLLHTLVEHGPQSSLVRLRESLPKPLEIRQGLFDLLLSEVHP